MKKIIVIDDEPSILQVIKFALEQEGWVVHTDQDPTNAMQRIKQEFFDILLTDLSMPKVTGLDVLKYAQEHSPASGVIIMTAYGTLSNAIEAMREGAYDFVPKPFEIKHLIHAVEQVYQKTRLKSENKVLRKIITKKMTDKKIIGQSTLIKKVLSDVEKVAGSDSDVLITGETGTGKELIARRIHQRSTRAQKAFIPINCAAIPEHLLESELFGYRKGAFSGAHQDKVGLFEACDQGTLFLDEIGEIPFALQSKLLRVIAEGKFIPLGSTQEKSVDVRIIAATHQDLEQRIQDQLFRQDLYYRINVVGLHMPALRERKEDIPELAMHFLKKHCKEYAKDIQGFEEEALKKLENYHFPGNIRELAHLVEQAIIFEEQNIITPQSMMIHRKPIDVLDDETEHLSLDQRIVAFEKKEIQRALAQHRGAKTKAAKSLGITFRSLRYRIKKLEMEEGSDDKP